MYANFFNQSLLVHNKFSAWRNSLSRDIHLRARGIVEEFHASLTIGVNLHPRLPIEGATEILHRWHHAVVLHFETFGFVESLEMSATDSLLLAEELWMGIDKDSDRVKDGQFVGLNKMSVVVVVL